MKVPLNIKTKILASAIASIFSATALAGNTDSLIKESPHNIYHVVKNKTLLDAANQLSGRSGITFKIDAAIESDIINQKLAADNWQAALDQLLQGYNYTTVSDKGTVKTVLVTGHNNNGQQLNPAKIESNASSIVVASDFSETLPLKYKNFNQGSVFNVKLPLEELANIAVGEKMVLDLPIGQYSVRHDDQIEHDDGSSTWVGHLDDEGKGYRIYISQGDAGVMGNVYTPEGMYDIETTDGHTFLVDIGKSGLQSAGYAHDQAEPSPEASPVPGTAALMDAGFQANANATANAAVTAKDLLSSLSATAQTARATANALAAQVKTLYTAYQAAVTNAISMGNAVLANNSNLNSAKMTVFAAQAALNKSPKDATLKAKLAVATNTLNLMISKYNQAVAANAAAVVGKNTAKAAYDKKVIEANTAEATAKTAEKAYAAELAKSSAITVATTTVDLMVLYTAVGQTADFAKQRIKYLVDVSNQAYKDSGIKMALRLVHTRSTTYIESNANSTALSDLAMDKGVFAGTANLRNQYGADLVMLFRPLYAATAGSCGTTYVGFANGGGGNAAYGYGTIGDGYSKDSKTGYYCAANTFTHEIGHSLGNVHDREYSTSFSGKFSYSYAWGINGKFGTIMSYYGPVILLFSTPTLSTQCAGTPCGFAETDASRSSDQVKTTNYTASLVASYRATSTTAPVIQ
ncbi:MAG: zinc-dependent metalloprotease family protein [Methylobacter sp.]|nr:zinc-dependent metalloprotease family protein [Methylobacter sp.]